MFVAGAVLAAMTHFTERRGKERIVLKVNVVFDQTLSKLYKE